MSTSNAFSRRRSRTHSHVTSNDRVSAALARAQARRDRESSKLEEMESIDAEVTSTIHEQKIGKSLRRVEQRKTSKLKLTISSSQEDKDLQKINSYNTTSSPRNPLAPKSQASAMSLESLSIPPRSLDVSPKHQNVPTDDRNPVTELSGSTFSSVNQENYYSPSNHLLTSTNTTSTNTKAALEPSANGSQHEACEKAESNKKENSTNILEDFYSDSPTKRDPPDDTLKDNLPASILSPLEQSLHSAIPKEFDDVNTELSAIREIMKKNEETIKMHCGNDNYSLNMEASTKKEKNVSRDFTEANKSPRTFDRQLEDVASKKSGAGWASSEPDGKGGTHHDDNPFRFNSVLSNDSVESDNVDVERLVKAFLSISSDTEESIPVPSMYKTKAIMVDPTERNAKNTNCGDVVDTIYEECNFPSRIVEKKESDEQKESFDASTMDSMLSITKDEDSFGESETYVKMSQNENSLMITKTTNTENSKKPAIEKEGNDVTIENTVNASSSLKIVKSSDLLKSDNAIEATQDATSAIKKASVKSHTNESSESDSEISSVDFAVYFETFKGVIADLREADGVFNAKGHQLGRFVEMATPLFVETQTIERLVEEMRVMAPFVNLPKHRVQAIIDMTFYQEDNNASIENDFDAIMRSNTMAAVDIADCPDEIEVDYNVGLLATGSAHTNNIPAESELIDQMRSNEMSSPTKDEIDNQTTEITKNSINLDTFADTCEPYNQSKDYENFFIQKAKDSSSPWSNGDSSRLQEFMDFAFPVITTGLTSTAEKQKLLDEAKKRSIPIEFVDHLLEMQIEMKEGQLTEKLSEEIRSKASEDLSSKFRNQSFDEIENIDESDRVSLNQEGELEVCNQAIRKPLVSIGTKEGQGSDSLEISVTEVLGQLSEVKSNNKILIEEEGKEGLPAMHEDTPKETLICKKDKMESNILKQAGEKAVFCKTKKGLSVISSHLENEVEGRASTEQETEEKLNSKEEEPDLKEDITEESHVHCEQIIVDDGSKVEKTSNKLNRSQVEISLQEFEGEECLWRSLDDNDKVFEDEHDRYEQDVRESWDNGEIGDRYESAPPEFEITNIENINDKCKKKKNNENERKCDDTNATGVDACELSKKSFRYENDDEMTDASKGNRYDPIEHKEDSSREGACSSPLKIETTQQWGDIEIETKMLGSREEKNMVCFPETGDDLGKEVVHPEDDDWQNASHSTAGEHHGYEPYPLEGSQSQTSGIEVNVIVGEGKADEESNINGEASSSYYSFEHLLHSHSSKLLYGAASSAAMSALESYRPTPDPVPVQSSSDDKLDMDSERYKVIEESKSEEWRRKHEILNMMKLKHMNRNPASNNRSSENSLNHQSSRRKHLGFTFHRGVQMCNQWKKSYKERTKGHPGYFNADVYSLYDSSQSRHLAHELDEVAWENRNVKQRFLHEHSFSMSRNWFGEFLKKRGNDRVREAVSHPKSMLLPMDQNSRPEEWTEEWFTTWKPRWEAQAPASSVHSGSSHSDSSYESDDDYDDEDRLRVRSSLSGGSSRSEQDSVKGPLESDFSTERYSMQSTFESSTMVDDDDEMSWEEELPECGILINVKPKIDERVSRIHPEFTSSLRRSRWRKKYFPPGTFPY